MGWSNINIDLTNECESVGSNMDGLHDSPPMGSISVEKICLMVEVMLKYPLILIPVHISPIKRIMWRQILSALF